VLGDDAPERAVASRADLIDRLGRFIGAAWIVTAVVYAYIAIAFGRF